MAEKFDQIQIILTEAETLQLHWLAERKQMDKSELIFDIVRRGIKIMASIEQDKDAGYPGFEEDSPAGPKTGFH